MIFRWNCQHPPIIMSWLDFLLKAIKNSCRSVLDVSLLNLRTIVPERWCGVHFQVPFSTQKKRKTEGAEILFYLLPLAIVMLSWLGSLLKPELYFSLKEKEQSEHEREADRIYFRGRRLITGHRYSQQSNLAKDVESGKELLVLSAEMGHMLAILDLSCCVGQGQESRIDWTKVRELVFFLKKTFSPFLSSLVLPPNIVVSISLFLLGAEGCQVVCCSSRGRHFVGAS